MIDSAHVIQGPISRSHHLVADDIVRHLERLIVTGELEPGAFLPPERALARELGVSRNALREALTQLDVLGLIQRRRGSGNRVSRTIPLTATLATRLQDVPADFDHSAEFRALIEPQVVRLAARRIDNAQLDALTDILEQAHHEMDPDQSASLDISFHTAIARATGNPLLATLGELTASWTVEARVYSHLEGEGRRLSHAGHARILESLTARDPEAADYAMRIHLAEVKEVIERVRALDHLPVRSDQFG